MGILKGTILYYFNFTYTVSLFIINNLCIKVNFIYKDTYNYFMAILNNMEG